MERQCNACQTPRSTYLSIFNSFRVTRCLSQCVSPKIDIFTTFLFPLRTPPPGTITLNVVWVEREFDAYKVSRCMCPSIYNRFWDTARYLWTNRHFFIPPCIRRPVRGVPVGISPPRLVCKKTRMVGLPDGEKIEDMCNRLRTIPACDGHRQRDRRTPCHGIYAYASRSKNSHGYLNNATKQLLFNDATVQQLFLNKH